ncbi:ankyrin repeat domain-containing protein [Hydrogenophaga sp. XSHU_21]
MTTGELAQDLARVNHLASRGDTGELLAFLADMRHKHFYDEFEDWALVAAAEANQIETVTALLDKGVNPNRTGSRSQIQPLWKAAKRGHIKVVKLLVANGADVSAADALGMTALDYARRYSHAEVEAYLSAMS